MNNEIGRKLTSLTLMTIMLAGGMTIAAPSMMPQAAAAGQLFVSAENANFNNFFAGVQVVEIIVRDPKATETDEKQQEPTVKVDEHLLRLAQGADGYWYAYIADKTDFAAAHTLNNSSNVRIHTGYQVSSEVLAGAATLSWSSAAQVYHTVAMIEGAPTLSQVNLAGSEESTATGEIGQIGVTASKWPVVQAFDFTSKHLKLS